MGYGYLEHHIANVIGFDQSLPAPFLLCQVTVLVEVGVRVRVTSSFRLRFGSLIGLE